MSYFSSKMFVSWGNVCRGYQRHYCCNSIHSHLSPYAGNIRIWINCLDLLTFNPELIIVNWTLWNFRTTHLTLDAQFLYFPNSFIKKKILIDFAEPRDIQATSKLRATTECSELVWAWRLEVWPGATHSTIWAWLSFLVFKMGCNYATDLPRVFLTWFFFAFQH